MPIPDACMAAAQMQEAVTASSIRRRTPPQRPALAGPRPAGPRSEFWL